MSEPRTEAGRQHHDMRHDPEFCSDPCPLREETAAIENAAALDALAKVEAAVRAALVNDYAKAAILAAIEQVKRGYQP